ncbi:MAG: inositol 2-dehydrogenase [Pseudomonadota bacterium]
MTVHVALFGAGRIGLTHARAMASIDNARIDAVHDPVEEAAAHAASLTGARQASIEEILVDPAIHAVIVATPTDLHAGQVEAAARAGKAVFCEKPIDLDVERVRACLDVVRMTGASLMIGFNRRFDPSFAALRRRLQEGAIGKVELVQITSRDPAPPGVDYLRRSGGLFRDMMVHDFDMARFLLNEDVVEVSATGSALVDPAIAEVGDVDTATATLRTASGRIAVITNSRRATYGYDQRAEVHGSLGMLAVGNPALTTVSEADGDGFRQGPLHDFFMTRYTEAYRLELEHFVHTIKAGTPPSPDGTDGLRALELADAAWTSLLEKRIVRLG